MKKKLNPMQRNPFIKFVLLIVISASLWSCDEDFMETGNNLINTIELPPLYETDNIIAYSKRVNQVETSNFTMHSLADFTDPVYGDFKSSVLAQLQLSQTNNDFGTDPQLDSVTLTLPFFSRLVEENVYELDSVYGSGEFVLKVYRSNQFLRNLNPGPDGDFTEMQSYYSDQLPEFLPNIESTPIAESEPIDLADYTTPLSLVQRSGTESVDTLSLSPRIRLNLPVDLFNEVILDKIGSPELASNANFVNFFRGLYIEVERIGQDGASMHFDLNNDDAGVTLHYQTQRQGFVTNEEEEPEFETNWNRFNLNFEGINVNLFDDSFTVDASNPNLEEGDENLYLKGGAGYYSVMELFTGPDSDADGVSDELQDLRDRNVLVNDAQIDLYLNEEATDSINRVNRIIVFNIDNNEVLIDYIRDRTAGTLPASSRVSHLGPLMNVDSLGLRYRLRITDYINQVITQDSTNAKLGLMVTDNVNATGSVEAQTTDNQIESIFRQTAQFTKGTVLHGSNTSEEDEEKRIKLKIQLTEIN